MELFTKKNEGEIFLEYIKMFGKIEIDEEGKMKIDESKKKTLEKVFRNPE